jgi:endoglucanase
MVTRARAMLASAVVLGSLGIGVAVVAHSGSRPATPRAEPRPTLSRTSAPGPTRAPTPAPAPSHRPPPTPTAAPAASPASTPAPAPPPRPRPPARSTPFYGFSLSELQAGPASEATIQVAEAEVQAIHDAWHANTVRLQIVQDELAGTDGSCALTADGCLAYYQEIQAVTNFALGLGLTVVINDTTSSASGPTASEQMPTQATEVVWKDIAASYAGNPHVIFDLFNEPLVPGGDGAAQWRVWRDGGQIGDVSYLGMQTVLSYIRNTLRATNMVWAEGLLYAGTLNGIAAHMKILFAT